MKKIITQSTDLKNNSKISLKKTPSRTKNRKTDFTSTFFSYPYSDSQDDMFYHQNNISFSDSFIHSPISKVNKQNNTMIWCYSITPIHLKNLDIICKIFGRSRYTIKQWIKEGAPIVYDGVSYISEYNALFSWLLEYYRDTAQTL